MVNHGYCLELWLSSCLTDRGCASGHYSFNFNKNLTFGYVEKDLSNLDTSKNKLYIEVGKVKYEAEYLAKPLNQNSYKTI